MADEMDVVENLEAMDDSSSTTTSSGESSGAEAESGQEDMMEEEQEEGVENEEEEKEKATNPAFSKFMQGFWDLASVDVPVRCVVCCCSRLCGCCHVLNRSWCGVNGPACGDVAHLCCINHRRYTRTAAVAS